MELKFITGLFSFDIEVVDIVLVCYKQVQKYITITLLSVLNKVFEHIQKQTWKKKIKI